MERGSSQALDFPLAGYGPLSQLARAYGFHRFAELAEAIRRMPYGRAHDSEDIAAVMREQKGTCSSKHRFLAAVAHECGRMDVQLMLGLYEMSEANTPGVGAALGELQAIPEAHCYLMHEGKRFDFTGLAGGVASPFESLVEERVVSPADLPSAKVSYHRRALEAWAHAHGVTPDAAWAMRQQCIEFLANRP